MDNNINSPRVTVLLPVFNGENYLREAIESILAQTFHDFEFLIINDGSTDKSVEIIRSYADPRIRLVVNEQNLGLIATLNKGVDLSRGEYIARMDQDDISLHQRLEKQISFLDKNRNVGVLGTWVRTFGSVAETVWDYPGDPETIKCRFLFESVLAHPSTMLRKKMLNDHNLYYSNDHVNAEDYEMWVRCSRYADISNLQEVLLLYRFHEEKIGSKRLKEQQATTKKIRREQLNRLLLSPTADDLIMHDAISKWEFKADKDYIEKVHQWLCKVQSANSRTSVYSEPAFSRVLAQRWFAFCNEATVLGFWIWKTYWRSPFSKDFDLDLERKIRFGLETAVHRRKTNG